MSDIRDIPDVKDASGIFKFDAGKKAILVPIRAVEGLDKLWEDYAKETGVAILPYNRCDTSIDDWEELCKMVHYSIEYGVNCNDLSSHELAENITFALDRFAKKNGLPEHPWDDYYEDLYAENSSED